MEREVQYLLFILALISMQISYAESHLHKKLSDIPLSLQKSNEDNICEIDEREIKLHCICELTAANAATFADCWIFHENIEETDPIWSTFELQSNIQKLYFHPRPGADLRFIPLNIINKLKNLEKLQIQYSTIDKIHMRTFSKLMSLKSLKLMKDKITELEFSAFADLPKLEYLSIKHNRLTEIQRDVFVHLPRLKKLDLSVNNISIIHDSCFIHVPALKYLTLENNSIRKVTKNTFKGLGNLTRLDLRSNKIITLDDLTFSEMWNLDELLLDNNLLEYLSERAFDGLTKLKKLTMTGNLVRRINEGLFEGVRGLELLDLRNNELEYFTYRTIKPVIANLKVLYLSGNKLLCDCRVLWIQSLQNETESEPLQLSLSEVTCVSVKQADKVINSNNISKEGVEDNYEEELATQPTVTELVVIDIPPESLICHKQLDEQDLNNSKEGGSWNRGFYLMSNNQLILFLFINNVV